MMSEIHTSKQGVQAQTDAKRMAELEQDRRERRHVGQQPRSALESNQGRPVTYLVFSSTPKNPIEDIAWLTQDKSDFDLLPGERQLRTVQRDARLALEQSLFDR